MLGLSWLAAFGSSMTHRAAQAHSISQLSKGKLVLLHHKLIDSHSFLQWPTSVCCKCLYSQRQMPPLAHVVNGFLAESLTTLDCLLTQSWWCREAMKPKNHSSTASLTELKLDDKPTRASTANSRPAGCKFEQLAVDTTGSASI